MCSVHSTAAGNLPVLRPESMISRQDAAESQLVTARPAKDSGVFSEYLKNSGAVYHAAVASDINPVTRYNAAPGAAANRHS
ncbi:hypothetical protein D3C76_1713930 [compost metagenome]